MEIIDNYCFDCVRTGHSNLVSYAQLFRSFRILIHRPRVKGVPPLTPTTFKKKLPKITKGLKVIFP